MSAALPEHVAVNRQHWDDHAHEWVELGERRWAGEPIWGLWDIPNDQLPLLPDDLSGHAAIELGCGTGYVSGWMTHRGATVTAIDNSAGQLQTARRLAEQHDARIDFIHGNAEEVPRPDGTFDFAISEYGAAIWCDPDVWLREAWRLLRPGGALVFLGNHPLVHVASPLDGSLPIERTFHRPWFDLKRLDWRDAVDEPGGIEFTLPTSGWFALFNRLGLRVEDYAEPRSPSADAGDIRSFVTADWAHDFPTEQVWWLRKPG